MALNLALDGNRYTDYCRGLSEVVEVIKSADLVAIPFIVIAELRAGFRGGSKSAENEQQLTKFLQGDRILILFPDDASTHFYANIYNELRRIGRPVPTNDLWIAALVMQHDLVLFSRDRHFDRIPHIARC